jgi:hypothetical protein
MPLGLAQVNKPFAVSKARPAAGSSYAICIAVLHHFSLFATTSGR